MSHWMKAKPTLLLLMLLMLVTAKLHADTNTKENQEEISSDFLEFIAEMEEVTGNGFENWLEDDNENNDINEFRHNNTVEQLQ